MERGEGRPGKQWQGCAPSDRELLHLLIRVGEGYYRSKKWSWKWAKYRYAWYKTERIPWQVGYGIFEIHNRFTRNVVVLAEWKQTMKHLLYLHRTWHYLTMQSNRWRKYPWKYVQNLQKNRIRGCKRIHPRYLPSSHRDQSKTPSWRTAGIMRLAQISQMNLPWKHHEIVPGIPSHWQVQGIHANRKLRGQDKLETELSCSCEYNRSWCKKIFSLRVASYISWR